MTTTERLSAIKAKCRANLAIAEKRTQGTWCADGYDVRQGAGGRMIAYAGPHHTPASEYPLSCKLADERNAAFIATCAGAAEAGWKSTIAAIDQLLTMKRDTLTWDFVGKPMQDAILSAWPEELL